MDIPVFYAIGAYEFTSRGIGKDGKMAWKVPEDMAFFTRVTKQIHADVYVGNPSVKNVCIVGATTAESMGPLPDRINIALSKSGRVIPGFTMYSDLREALIQAGKMSDVSEIFVIGGEKVYKQAFEMVQCRKVYLTELKLQQVVKYDSFMPELKGFEMVSSSGLQSKTGDHIKFKVFERKHGELQYLDLVRRVIGSGEEREDRTKVGTYSITGHMMRWNLKNGFPLLTTKRVFWKGVVEELLWFLSAKTDSEILERVGVSIWKKNSSLEFLKQRSKEAGQSGNAHAESFLANAKKGECGPVYGFNWRHFGGDYYGCDKDSYGGFDQITWLVEQLKKESVNPSSRRLLLTSYDPSRMDYVVLPPCHVLCHFTVSNGKELSCHLFVRSNDLGLGFPFNLASYSLLTMMFAQVAGLGLGELIYTIGDAHVYKTHVNALCEQMNRTPNEFPTVKLNPCVVDMDSWTSDDIVLEGYNPHERLNMEMAV